MNTTTRLVPFAGATRRNTRLKRPAAMLLLLLACAQGALTLTSAPGEKSASPQTLRLGTRTFTITQKTRDGTPVINMWKAQTPTSNQSKACGFPVLKDAQHADVWKPASRREGAFNHYAALFFHNGRFFAMWGNHWFGENCPGQRVLFSTSKDGRSWSPPAELFPPPGTVGPKDNKSIYLTPDRWVAIDGKLYAIAYVHRAGIYPIAREVSGDASRLGEPFLLDELPPKGALPRFLPEPRINKTLGAKIRQWYVDNDMVCWWAHSERTIPSRGIDKARLIEPFAFRSKHGMVVCMRDYSSYGGSGGGDAIASNRIYASFPDGKGSWSPMYPTDIPDSHSRAQALRLPDGRVLLVGNQIASRFDKGIYLERDPLTLAISPDGEYFTKVFALRAGAASGARPKHRFKTMPGAPDIVGSGPPGYGYASMIVHDGMLYVLYSVNKEDMAITSVPLASLAIGAE